MNVSNKDESENPVHPLNTAQHLPRPVAPLAQSVRSTTEPLETDKSRRIYEEIFAGAISQSSSSFESVDAQPNVGLATSGRYYSILGNDGASSASFCSAPTDEEEGTDRNHRLPVCRQLPPTNDVTTGETHLTPPRTVKQQPPVSEDTPSTPQRAAFDISAGLAGCTTPVPLKLQSSPKSEPRSGGRLWRLAGEMAAAKKAALLEKTRAGPVGHLAESFLERMRSRADPNAQVAPPTPPRRPTMTTTQPIMVKMTSSSSDDFREDEAFLMNTGVAHKRVRVVQLLIIGLVGILLAWLGNFFVSSSCYFVSVPVDVGQYGDVFTLHFGLWNYSPVESALNGYKYCSPYSEYHQSDAPILSRAFNLAALLLGTYSLVVLWWYLISGRVVPKLWKAAVYAAVGAGALQLITPLVFFLGSLCRNSKCSAGSAASLSAVTAVAWVIVAAELHYHCPVEGTDPVHETCVLDEQGSDGSKGSTTTPVAQLEMADLAGASQEYLDRFHKNHAIRRSYRPPDLT